jgi:hypothetical protein
MQSILRTIMLIFCLVPVVGDGASILNIEDAPISLKTDGTSFTDQEIRNAIIEGCIAKGWSPVVDDEGAIRATILVRQEHFAEVEITHTPTTFSITYVSSKNLNYSEKRQKIHRNYNRWIVNLSASITKSLSERMSSISPTPVEAHADTVTEDNQQDVYSELMKLDDLRQKGILTDEEFAAQKKKLLEAD